ncbi:MAG: NAD(P)-dependent oxidoreductase [Novosphingobium sp.]
MATANKPLALVLMTSRTASAPGIEPHCDIVWWGELADRDAFLAERGAEVRVLVTAGSIPIRPKLTDRLPNLGLIAFYGAGYGGVDVKAMRARGVSLSYCPATNHEDVADVAVGLTISTVRRLSEGDRMVRSSEWTVPVPIRMTPSMRTLRYGIVGLGAIGTAIAERIEPIGGTIAWWGPRPKQVRWPRADSLIALARDSDVLILALKADAETANIVDADVLAALGSDGYLVNISRGIAVDEDALLDALRNERLAGAGLDVFAREPSDAAKWRDLDNVALSPHIAGWARASIEGSQAHLSETLRRYFAGAPLLTPIPD